MTLPQDNDAVLDANSLSQSPDVQLNDDEERVHARKTAVAVTRDDADAVKTVMSALVLKCICCGSTECNMLTCVQYRAFTKRPPGGERACRVCALPSGLHSQRSNGWAVYCERLAAGAVDGVCNFCMLPAGMQEGVHNTVGTPQRCDLAAKRDRALAVFFYAVQLRQRMERSENNEAQLARVIAFCTRLVSGQLYATEAEWLTSGCLMQAALISMGSHFGLIGSQRSTSQASATPAARASAVATGPTALGRPPTRAPAITLVSGTMKKFARQPSAPSRRLSASPVVDPSCSPLTRLSPADLRAAMQASHAEDRLLKSGF